ncbi:uncharacterized protein LOC126833711 isoform X2 [Adelges cooleyi]|uniref:uncharacterized protein LOC126833711 isoform X2 n=1 Tax=Adelges cooleyi TaxID=133065 RepID=UPI002180955D|nr:uncharacterized protein LOC126833711 isoform X2 [Adelges cooleyi]
MFSTNIILVLCVVGIIEKSNTAGNENISDTVDAASTSGTSGVVNTKPNVDNLTYEQWQEIFKRYDNDNDGFISTSEFQILVFNEFQGFLTIRQAETYFYLIKLEESNELELEQLIQMKPIIFVLSKGKSELDIEYFGKKNSQLSTQEVVYTIAILFKNVFSDEKEVLEVLKLFGQNEISTIEWTKYCEILKMLGATLMMATIHTRFRANDNGVVDFADNVSLCHNSVLSLVSPGTPPTEFYNEFKRILDLLKCQGE